MLSKSQPPFLTRGQSQLQDSWTCSHGMWGQKHGEGGCCNCISTYRPRIYTGCTGPVGVLVAKKTRRLNSPRVESSMRTPGAWAVSLQNPCAAPPQRLAFVHRHNTPPLPAALGRSTPPPLSPLPCARPPPKRRAGQPPRAAAPRGHQGARRGRAVRAGPRHHVRGGGVC